MDETVLPLPRAANQITWIKEVNGAIAVFHHVDSTTFGQAIGFQIRQILQMHNVIGNFGCFGYRGIVKVTLSFFGRKSTHFFRRFEKRRLHCGGHTNPSRYEATIRWPFAVAVNDYLKSIGQPSRQNAPFDDVLTIKPAYRSASRYPSKSILYTIRRPVPIPKRYVCNGHRRAAFCCTQTIARERNHLKEITGNGVLPFRIVTLAPPANWMNDTDRIRIWLLWKARSN